MRVAYAYEWDANDRNTQSGRPRAILDQLHRRGVDVAAVFPLDNRLQYLFAAKYLINKAIGRTYRPDREWIYIRSLARQIERRVRELRVDCVFAPGSHAVAALDLPVPKVFCADATFANVLETYDDFADCSAGFVRAGHALDRNALAGCAAAIYPTEWAADTARRVYGADPDKVHVVPFGANVVAPPEEAVLARTRRRRDGAVRILFVGRKWHRKGADIVLEACTQLVRSGFPVQLHLVGLASAPADLPDFVVRHGLLNKNATEQRARLEMLLRESDLFFVPSRAENYGMAFCEAAAFGLPAISTRVGGIPTIVEHGVTGILHPPDANPAAYAESIARLIDDPAGYEAMSMAAWLRFRRLLNWDAFGDRLIGILAAACETVPTVVPASDPPAAADRSLELTRPVS